MSKKTALVISCEHGTNAIPPAYQMLFQPFKNLLESHRGIDFGALEIALHFKEVLPCDLILASTSRMFIECNRSINHKRLFSEVTHPLPEQQKQEIITQYYLPYRQSVMDHIEKHQREGARVIHLSIHSFTPIMDNKVRNADIGLLYDPRRTLEKTLAKEWMLEIKKQTKDYRVRMNYPYKGISDGLVTSLRKKYAPDAYVGIEVESNQAITQNPQTLKKLKDCLASSFLPLM